MLLFHGPNAGWVVELYDRYRKNPQAVDAETQTFFETWTPPVATALPQGPGSTVSGPCAAACRVAIIQVVQAIRKHGHLVAQIDPVGANTCGDADFPLGSFGVTEADLRALPADFLPNPLAQNAPNALEGLRRCWQIYAGPIGVEADHIGSLEAQTWIYDVVETGRFFQPLDAEYKRELLEQLTKAATFEQYLQQEFPGQKRFSIEGTDMVVPLLDAMLRGVAATGVREVVLGMTNRGRLNVLAHVLDKPYAAILAEFGSTQSYRQTARCASDDHGWSGDVKYHLGACRQYRHGGAQLRVTLLPNPSHLEFVDPVVVGRARAAQDHLHQRGAPVQDEEACLAILVHGDAAFPGQGVVTETLNLSRLPAYHSGGTIHVIVNNQIGFTTEPHDARSTCYASDLAKGFGIPIIHVNADDPEACIAVARMACAYRERFHSDVLIDLVGYRRWGHYEGDEPAFTQPRLYAAIAAHPPVRDRWANTLIEQEIVTAEEVQRMVRAGMERLERARHAAQSNGMVDEVTVEPTQVACEPIVSAVSVDHLRALNEALLAWPGAFTVHPKLDRLWQRRRTALNDDDAIDWAHAETLAFASILADGTPIRLTGQDVERGTFSQRHLVLHDVRTGRRYVPLQELPQARAAFAVDNSPLSENAALGFEYGYSTHAPDVLVLWEAQFGDFANGAQVIIDQFIVAGRAKWRQRSGLVLLLPHGYEGQGPEHSSARIERFLQLAAGDNMRIANCTTAAQYYHLLRRQAATLCNDPRPLVVMTPKSLLRHPYTASSLGDLTNGSFQPVLDDLDAQKHSDHISRVILCSGKVYIDLVSSAEWKRADQVAAVRIEELHPFPTVELKAILSRYPQVREVVWVQEEPRNMGAWSYVAQRLQEVLDSDVDLHYVGRPARASPAEGSLQRYQAEQARILKAAVANVSALIVPEPVQG